jgi:hypothetical protein
MNLPQLKSLFFKVLIACLVGAAGLAVVTVLIGQFNGVCEKALFTILLVAVHSLVGIGFISNNEKQDTFDTLSFFTNATFGIIVLSFITSVLGTWDILGGGLVGRLYALYFVLLFATLHGEVLAKTRGKQSNIDTIVGVNFLFMLAVVCLLVPLIFMSGTVDFPAFYFRILAACGIVDATLTLVAVILHKLYMQKHPKVIDPVFAMQSSPQSGVAPQNAAPQPERHMNIFVVLLIGYVVLQIGGGIAVAIYSAINR